MPIIVGADRSCMGGHTMKYGAKISGVLLTFVALFSLWDTLRADALGPGYWAYPSKPLEGEALAKSCRTGFSIVFANGSYLAVLATGRAVHHDETGRCTLDADSVQRCTGTRIENGRALSVQLESRQQTVDGRVKLTTKTTETPRKGRPSSHVTESFPARCPDEAVHDVLQRGLAPGRRTP
jgi:hypothetical protein